MDTNMIIEMVGYCGSLLVLVSFLMTSVFKLRVVNSIGSVIFMIYALIIKSYPTAVMNFCLVLINIHFLWKMSRTETEFDFVESSINDGYFKYFLEENKEDINKYYPSLDFPQDSKVYFVSRNSRPLGLTVAQKDNDTLNLLMDYSVKEYRDFSIATYLFEKLAQKGIKKVTFTPPTNNHEEYLNKFNFTKNGDVYEKILQ